MIKFFLGFFIGVLIRDLIEIKEETKEGECVRKYGVFPCGRVSICPYGSCILNEIGTNCQAPKTHPPKNSSKGE